MQEKKPTNTTKPTEAIEVSPEEEASILSSIKLEASSFVPDKLQDVLKAAEVQEETVTPKEEAMILASVQVESKAFVPDDFTKIAEATGTVQIPHDQESLAIHEKVKNEGAEIVPDVEDTVLAETGTKKKHWSLGASFKKHWIPWVSGLATVAASIAVVAVIATTNKTTAVTLAYVSVDVQSASSYNNTSVSAVKQAETSTTINSYIPSFSFIANGKNIAKASTLSADNYSASLVKAKITSITDQEAPSFITDKLLLNSYNLGYLETKQAGLNNHITVTITSNSSTYLANYKDSYTAAITKYLSDKNISAKLDINTTEDNASDYLSGLSEEKSQKVIKACALLTNDNVNDANRETYLKALAKEDDTLLDNLISALTACSSSTLSDQALTDIRSGISLAYLRYINGYTLDSTEKASNLQMKLAYKAYLLPWARTAFSPRAGEFLNDNSYYIISNADFEKIAATRPYANIDIDRFNTPEEALSVFFHIRDLINAETTDVEDFDSLLTSVKMRAEQYGHEPGAFPDEHGHDDGDHGGPGGHDGDWDGGW